MPFQIVRNDITQIQADAIVNTANPQPICGSGTDYAVYQAAGADQLLEARQQIGILQRGEVAVTPAFALKAKYIFHAIGPKWIDGQSGEFDILTSCYQRSLDKALELGCKSIAFPLMATGVYRFPKDKALQIAIQVISAFLLEHEMDVLLVVFDRESFELSGKIFDDVASFIDDIEVHAKHADEYQSFPIMTALSASHHLDGESVVCESASGIDTLDDLLNQNNETFQQCLFRMIDARGLKDSEVYARANLDRKLFSKIRCNPDYHPKKKTAVALAIALQLDMNETTELLEKAEWALSSSSKFDIIVTYFIQKKHYDILTEINPTLFKYGQPTLGA